MLRKVNNMKELEDVLYDGLRAHAQSIAVELTIPGQKDTEFVINKYSSIRNKISYYKRTYGEDLAHNRVPSIKILSAGYGDTDLWDNDNEENK